jgi:hypothetical protein
MDAPSTPEDERTFPAHLENEVKAAINETLDKYKASPADKAVVGGMAAGGDLLFIETCIERGIPVEAYLPVTEATYVREFVSLAGESWVERFYKVRNHPQVTEHYQTDRIGPCKTHDNIFERNNRWTLYSSLSRGVDKTRLIALWDGKRGKVKARDAILVKHMVDLMREMGGQVEQINPEKLILNPLPDDLPTPTPAAKPKKQQATNP